MARWTGKRVGLALGGGGVRGFSHIGVLKVLEQEAIGIDIIAGTSVGAIIGASYASGQSPREIHRRLDAYLSSPEFQVSTLKALGLSVRPGEGDFFQKTWDFVKNRLFIVRSFFQPAILPTQDLQSLIDYFIPDILVQETRIPFSAVATDLITGETIIFREGPLRHAVLASCAVPGAVEPVRQGEWLLADGGIISLVPVHAVRQAGADVVIAVVVDRDIRTLGSLDTAQDIFYRAGEITADKLEAIELRDADVIIRPRVGDLHWMDFSRARDLVREGEEAARAALKKADQALPLYKKALHLVSRRIPALKKRLRLQYMERKVSK